MPIASPHQLTQEWSEGGIRRDSESARKPLDTQASTRSEVIPLEAFHGRGDLRSPLFSEDAGDLLHRHRLLAGEQQRLENRPERRLGERFVQFRFFVHPVFRIHSRSTPVSYT